MYYKNTSCKIIIAQVFRDFRPSYSGWVGDAIEWIGTGMEIIGHGVGYERKPIVHTVKEYRSKLKCSVHAIEMVEHEGFRLPPNDAVNSLKVDKTKNGNRKFYTLNPNYINTSFECGEVTIYADVIPVDNEGYPMIPDEALHKEALTWWVFSKMLGRGLQHPVFKYEDAYKQWLFYYPQAQNAGLFPSIDQMEEFTRRWTATIPNFEMGSVFLDQGGDINVASSAELPRDNTRTIIHVDPS